MVANASPRLATIQVGLQLTGQAYTPGIAELVLYGAAICNAHRIHYDLAYCQAEQHPGIVITGPLQAAWLAQVATDWLGDAGVLESLSFSHRGAAYLGETLTTGGSVAAVDTASGRVTLGLHVRNAAGTVITPGEAVVRFRSG